MNNKKVYILLKTFKNKTTAYIGAFATKDKAIAAIKEITRKKDFYLYHQIGQDDGVVYIQDDLNGGFFSLEYSNIE